MSVNVSPEMLLTGYFLARCGRRSPNRSYPAPPVVLGTDHWRVAYAVFFDALAGSRTLSVFSNSLKNIRDRFDSHLENGRVGWREPGQAERGADAGRRPLLLPRMARKVAAHWAPHSDAELWDAVRPWADSRVASVSAFVLADLHSEPIQDVGLLRSRTEGGQRVYISVRVERSPALKAAALRIHGSSCACCHIDFGTIYGRWGKNFAEVHHVVPLAAAGNNTVSTDPRTDLVVLCPNCHRMIHRKKDVTLSLDELREKLNWSELRRWAERVAQ